MIKTNNVATSYFLTQKKLTPKQAWWQDLLVEFDYIVEYKLARANLIADALSHKGRLTDVSRPQSNLQDRIKNGHQHDPLAQTITHLSRKARLEDFCKKMA